MTFAAGGANRDLRHDGGPIDGQRWARWGFRAGVRRWAGGWVCGRGDTREGGQQSAQHKDQERKEPARISLLTCNVAVGERFRIPDQVRNDGGG